ncbi:type IV toxin-antitoxin system AbiEi family antitoxin domain-containing protein, partial [Halorhodospira halochloris]|uniref:type IV toxin-antitoxin system AbiEi family antitoxin domain-containing protein n=1 Tax=Halorhodospira halochloris TaxID=1052 RepID=UPI001EE84BE5|nr:type IV toxin-antitoxin system AbiEi family antitoxin domain-containing protein [Halorhodospira halochloris]
MTASSFLATHRVFTAEEFGDALNLTSCSRDSLLAYYRQRGRILRIRRGLYWVLRTGETPESCSVDP